MRKFLSIVLLGALVMAGLGAPAAEAASGCKSKKDLPGQWWFSIGIGGDTSSPIPAVYLNCKIVYSKGGGVRINQSSCTDSFGSGYSATTGSTLSLNKNCRVKGQFVLTAIGEGSGSSNLILGSFQTGTPVRVVAELDSLRMVRDKLSMHGSGRANYSGTSTGGGSRLLVLLGPMNIIKR